MRCTFGRFHLDAAERRLLRDGQSVPLTPKAFETLLTLVKRACHAVSKDDLMRAVWPNGFVEESNLAFNISTLRKTLGEGQNGERYIETVPKLGYRFVMPVKVIEASSSPFNISHAKRSNLPAQLTRFIGRGHELVEVTAHVEKKRLVTLTGAGGVGKTRLALEAGAQLLKTFTDGVWLAEFASLTDEALVPATVASLFHLQDYPGVRWVDALINSIGEKHMLLIFDNCEHVIDASAKLAEALLQVCPNLHILATSREALRVAGEAIWHVAGLASPDVIHLLTLETAAGYDAIQLFVECAALKLPGFALTQKNAEVIAGICQQLDGLPLAIEMAAAQVDVLSLHEIAAALGDRFALLASDNRAVAPRHQTLRATMDWSYNQLSTPERALLAQLSVFRGGWTACAVQAICMAGDQDISSLLARLSRCSLVTCVVDSVSGETRYRLLESVRLYAGEKLRLTRSQTVVQDRHLQYFLGLAEAPTDTAGPQIEAWLPHIKQELDNIRVAFAHALVIDDCGERAMRLVYAMTRYWSFIGPADEWRNWAAQANGRGDRAPLWARARGMHSMFAYHLFSGAVNEALAVGTASLALFRQTQDRLGTAWCLETLANNSNSADVQPLAEEALHLFRELGSRDGEGRALRALGIAAYWAGDCDRAADLLEQSIAVAPWDLESCMGYFYFAHPQRALAICGCEVNRLIEQGIVNQYPSTIRIYAVLLMLEGQFENASLHYNTVVQLVKSHQAPAHFTFACYQMLPMAMIEHALHHKEAAMMWLEQAHQNAEDTHSHVVSYTARFLKAAFIDVDLEDENLVLHLAQYCLRGFHQLDFALGMICAFMLLAGRAGRHGNHHKALRLLGVVSAQSPVVAHQALWMDGVLWMWHRDAQTNIVAPALAAAREALGDEAFEQTYAAGQCMTLDEAVHIAL